MVNSVSTSAPDLYPTRVVDRFARRFRPHIRRFLPAPTRPGRVAGLGRSTLHPLRKMQRQRRGRRPEAVAATRRPRAGTHQSTGPAGTCSRLSRVPDEHPPTAVVAVHDGTRQLALDSAQDSARCGPHFAGAEEVPRCTRESATTTLAAYQATT